MRRKLKLLWLIIGIISPNMKAQSDPDFNFGDLPKPVPSVSTLSTYVNTPTSIATGIPEISIPLAKISTLGNKMDLGVVLGYHVGNVNQYEPAGEVGTGWSMLAGGVISREVIGEVDEKYDNTATGNYQKNQFDDLYYYNFPGGFGKFKITRDIVQDTFSLENLSANKIKFDYTRDSNTATLKLTSFILTDGKGFKYIFSDYSVATMVYSVNTRKEYKSAFFLSKILTPDNIEIANFTYQKDDRYIPNSSQLSYRSCKLKSIQSPGVGSITIDYDFENVGGTANDPYRVAAVSLKDPYGTVLEKFTFDYTFFDYSYGNITKTKRVLVKMRKAGKDLTAKETTNFIYDGSGSETVYSPNINFPYGEYLCSSEQQDPKNRTLGTLKWINLPTGGRIEYNFEANQVYSDKNSVDYLQTINENEFVDPETQYIKPHSQLSFDTHQDLNYLFTVTTVNPNIPKKLYFSIQVTEFYNDPFNVGTGELFVDYIIKKNGQIVQRGTCNPTNLQHVTYTLPAGSYTIQISGTGGKGILYIYDIGKAELPYKNATTFGAEGIRIKSIKNYESTFFGEPQKVTEYEYDDFADPLKSSGYVFSNENNGASSGIYLPYVLYKNVKVKENDKGYTKYYFKVPSDYPYINFGDNTVDPTFLPSYNITKKGVLEKVEAYNSENQLLSSKTMDYTFDVVPNGKQYIVYDNVKSTPAWTKNFKETERIYDPVTQSYIESKIENSYSSSNYELIASKKTSPDGNIIEKTVKYAIDNGNTKLINANIVSVPLELEAKNNGKIIEKSEAKYDYTTLILPSSHVSINPNDGTSKTQIRYDNYDNKGNLLQYTIKVDENGNGYPITIVWGYNQTLPIAKVEGAKYADVSGLTADIIAKSNADTDAASEASLLSALDSFRTNPSLKSFKITTYTYDPLSGITTVTPPSGIRNTYKYDESRRLKMVLDVNGNIVEDYKYNTKPQF